jgi:hypothetical protein
MLTVTTPAGGLIEQQTDLQRPLVQPRARQPLDALTQHDASDRGGVDRIGLAALAPAATRARHQPRRHPHRALTAGHQRAFQAPGHMPTVLDRPHPLATQPTRPPKCLLGSGHRRGDRQRAAQRAAHHVDRGEPMTALVWVRPDHDHPPPSLSLDATDSGLPTDTPQWGRCHAPIKSRRRSSNRRRATQRMKVRPPGRTPTPRVSSPPAEEPSPPVGQHTARGTDALTEATLSSLGANPGPEARRYPHTGCRRMLRACAPPPRP